MLLYFWGISFLNHPGFGCMRFPSKGGTIDEKLSEELVVSAIEQGVNYFDTAYVYNMGKSEITLGNILANGLTQGELGLFDGVRDILSSRIKVNYTGCRYCMPIREKQADFFIVRCCQESAAAVSSINCLIAVDTASPWPVIRCPPVSKIVVLGFIRSMNFLTASYFAMGSSFAWTTRTGAVIFSTS
jgi:hypothetical protein